MNEKIAKKVGEAHAFAEVLSTTFANNTKVMSQIFGDYAESIVEIMTAQREELQKIAEQESMAEVVLPKSEKTAKKISSMGETYVGDSWNDPAEVLEWMSFFVGGALIHWQLISGAAKEMNHEHFGNVAGVGTEYYATLVEQLRAYAVTIGTERAKA